MAGARPDILKAGASFLVKFESENWNQYSRRVAKDFQVLAQKIATVGRQMAIGSMIAAAPLIASMRIYAAYSKQLAFISTMLDNAADHMDAFSIGIRRMSVQFGESTDNLSRGLYDILSAGFAPAKAMEMLGVTTKAAVAGMTDAKNSTQAIIAVLNSYSLGAEYANEVSDSLFMTVRKGVLTFGELAGHIGMVSSTAAAAGVKMDEMGAVLATITRGGIETSHAVVALNNILKAFLSPTGASADFAEQLESMGLGPITTEGIKTKGFLNIMKEIAALPPDAIARLFPSIRGMRGIMALKANLKEIDEIYSAWLDKAGATDEAFAKVAASIGFLIDQLKQAGVLILSYIGEALAKDLAGVSVYVLNVAKGFGRWVSESTTLISVVGRTILLVGKLGVALWSVAKVLSIIATLTIMATSVGSWKNLIASIGLAVAAYSYMSRLMGRMLDEAASYVGEPKSNEEPDYTEFGIKRTNLVKRIESIPGIRAKIAAEREEIPKLHMWPFSPEKGWDFPQDSTQGQKNIKTQAALNLQLMKTNVLEEELQSRIDKMDKSRQKELDLIKAQNTALSKIPGMTTKTGFSLGYYHTPVLQYSSASEANPELDALRTIADNTASLALDGAGSSPFVRGLANAVKEKVGN